MQEEYVTLKWGDIVRIHGVNISKKNERKGLIISKGYLASEVMIRAIILIMHTNSNIMQKETKQLLQRSLKTQKITFKESFMGACTNIMYKLGAIGGLKRIPTLLKTSQGNKGLVILGEKISDIMIARQRLSKLIWFTYREKLKIAEDINSDVGWGCLPRVGQMVLAQALVRHFIGKGEVLDIKQYFRIIEPFLDSIEEDSSYSLSMILKYARWKYAISPGDWFNIGQLSDVLRKIQDEIPLAGSQNLRIVFFSQSVIFISLIMEKGKIKACKCNSKKLLCSACNQKPEDQINKQLLPNESDFKRSNSCNSGEVVLQVPEFGSDFIQIGEDEEPQKQQFSTEQVRIEHGGSEQVCDTQDLYFLSQRNKKCCESEMENHLLLIVSVRVAEKEIDDMDFNSMVTLLNLPSSLGIIGGVPSKALYLVGYEGDELIYLDPHYVQEHVDRDNYKANLHTFLSTQYRTINKQALDPSMAFCFYLRTIQDVQDLLILIQNLKEEYSMKNRQFYMSVMEKDNFEQEMKSAMKYCGGESPNDKNMPSCEYSSLQFRDIADSL